MAAEMALGHDGRRPAVIGCGAVALPPRANCSGVDSR